MKIIIATHDTKEQAISGPLTEAFKSLGHYAEVIFTYYSLFNIKIPYQIPQKFVRNYPVSFLLSGLIKLARSNLQSKVLKIIKDSKPDLLVVIKGKHISVQTIDEIRHNGVKTVNWFPDGMWNIGTLKRFTPHYDRLFVMDPNSKNALESAGFKNVSYLPMAACKLDNSKSLKQVLDSKEYDIAFVGTLASHKEREEVLGKIKNFNLKIWGTPEWASSSLSKFYRGQARGQKMLDIYQKSKIVVNIHVKDDLTQGPNLRSFEAMISGALVISDYKKGLADLFIDREDIVYFRDPEELPILVARYLNNSKEREKITSCGYNKVLSKHMMENRAQEILEKTFVDIS